MACSKALHSSYGIWHVAAAWLSWCVTTVSALPCFTLPCVALLFRLPTLQLTSVRLCCSTDALNYCHCALPRHAAFTCCFICRLSKQFRRFRLSLVARHIVASFRRRFVVLLPKLAVNAKFAKYVAVAGALGHWRWQLETGAVVCNVILSEIKRNQL